MNEKLVWKREGEERRIANGRKGRCLREGNIWKIQANGRRGRRTRDGR